MVIDLKRVFKVGILYCVIGFLSSTFALFFLHVPGDCFSLQKGGVFALNYRPLGLPGYCDRNDIHNSTLFMSETSYWINILIWPFKLLMVLISRNPQFLYHFTI
jgi:hypothetical protein